MAKVVKIACQCCGGSGMVALTGVYADTLALLQQQMDEVTGSELAKLAGCNSAAMCNRMVALERLGLAESRRYGVCRLWKAK